MDYSYYANSNQPYSLYGLGGLPTPDQNQPPQSGDPQAFSALNNYTTFDPSLRFDPSPFAPQPHSPPESFSKQSASSNEPGNLGEPIPVDVHDDQLVAQNGGRSSSEEKDGTVPPKSRRKEQNRAAQRAFRERKERHVRDLQEKVANLEQASNTLQADNARLKQELAKYTTENEILRATSSSLRHPSSSSPPIKEEPITTGPMKYTPTDFYSALIPEGEPNPRHRVTTCGETGERLLDAGATWDLIQGHELFQRGMMDIGFVSERLKGSAQCDGQGPAFREGAVRRAIEESAANGNNELI